jgi:hypothetical protein
MDQPANVREPSTAIIDLDRDRQSLLGVLVGRSVEFILIGGAAIQSHGGRYDTRDVDVTPNANVANLARLAEALNELDCRLITTPVNTANWVPLPPGYFTPECLLRTAVWNLATRYGQLDLCFSPEGFPGGYSELVLQAQERRAAGTNLVVLVAALDDINASKRAADRAKDRLYLRWLEDNPIV